MKTFAHQTLQVVNFNVRGRQYVVAGHLYNLEALSLLMSSYALTPPEKELPPLQRSVEQVVAQVSKKRAKLERVGEHLKLTYV